MTRLSPIGNPKIQVEIELDPLEYDPDDFPVFKAQVKRACEQVLPDTLVTVRSTQTFEITDAGFSRKVA